MGATKRDISGVFDAELKSRRIRKAAVLDRIFHLSPKGITFVTDTFLPEWTEVGVEMRLPQNGAHKDQNIGCRGVVVQCMRREQGKGFEVALLFLDLPKRARAHLATAPADARPLSISISR
jgi:hypothetical protein